MSWLMGQPVRQGAVKQLMSGSSASILWGLAGLMGFW